MLEEEHRRVSALPAKGCWTQAVARTIDIQEGNRKGRSATATMSATRRGAGCDMVLRPRNGIVPLRRRRWLDMGLMLTEPAPTRCFVGRGRNIPDQPSSPPSGRILPRQSGTIFTTYFRRPDLPGALDIVPCRIPCQPFSHAGQRRGRTIPCHLWLPTSPASSIASAILEWVFLENVSGHVCFGAETVLRELRDMGYTVAAGRNSAAETGAPHGRCRAGSAPRQCRRAEDGRRRDLWRGRRRSENATLAGKLYGQQLPGW